MQDDRFPVCLAELGLIHELRASRYDISSSNDRCGISTLDPFQSMEIRDTDPARPRVHQIFGPCASSLLWLADRAQLIHISVTAKYDKQSAVPHELRSVSRHCLPI